MPEEVLTFNLLSGKKNCKEIENTLNSAEGRDYPGDIQCSDVPSLMLISLAEGVLM